jgi:hypothetical protein
MTDSDLTKLSNEELVEQLRKHRVAQSCKYCEATIAEVARRLTPTGDSGQLPCEVCSLHKGGYRDCPHVCCRLFREERIPLTPTGGVERVIAE